MTEQRRFPPTWQVEEHSESFAIFDANGQTLAYVYHENEPGHRMTMKRLTQDEARRIRGQHCQAAAAPVPRPRVPIVEI